MDAHVEAYLDGELSAENAELFERRLHVESDWNNEVVLARHVRDGLRTLPSPACPPQVTQAVIAETRRRDRAARRQQVLAWIDRVWGQTWQPALAMSVLLLLVISAVLLGRPPQPTPQTAEVEQAMAEVKWALAYVSDVGRQTGETVRSEVLEERVVSSMNAAIRPFLHDHDTQSNEQ